MRTKMKYTYLGNGIFVKGRSYYLNVVASVETGISVSHDDTHETYKTYNEFLSNWIWEV